MNHDLSLTEAQKRLALEEATDKSASSSPGPSTHGAGLKVVTGLRAGNPPVDPPPARMHKPILV
jgi:hypothetical protein